MVKLYLGSNSSIVQTPVDWEMAIKTMESAGLIKPGHQSDEYFTNAFLE